MQAETGGGDPANTGQRVGLGLFFGGGDVSEVDDFVGDGFEHDGGDDAGVFALEGLYLAAAGAEGWYFFIAPDIV